MKEYVDLDEVVTTTEHTEHEIIVRTRTIADILDELDAEYTVIEPWEIQDGEE